MPGSSPGMTGQQPLGSGQQGENRLDLVRRRGQQYVIAGLAFGGGLQDDFGHVRFDPRGHLLHRNFGHYLVEDRAHDLDQFWTVARHDPLSRFVATGIESLYCAHFRKSGVPDWVTDLITAFAERARMSDAAVLGWT